VTNAVTIEEAAHTDAAALAALAAETFPDACPPEATAKEIADHIAHKLNADVFGKWIADPAWTILVAKDAAGEFQGYFALTTDADEIDENVQQYVTIDQHCELSKCYVRSSARGNGVADALMTATLERAKAAGARGVWLGVNGVNTRARAFYASHGFTEVGPRNYVVGGRVHDDYLMERAL
jgi:ribosomal protein S18 acetylase RimI-like enzyme